MTRLQQTLATSNEKLQAAEDKFAELSKNNDNVVKSLKSTEEAMRAMEKDYEGMERNLKEHNNDLEKESEKVKLLSLKLRKVNN